MTHEQLHTDADLANTEATWEMVRLPPAATRGIRGLLLKAHLVDSQPDAVRTALRAGYGSDSAWGEAHGLAVRPEKGKVPMMYRVVHEWHAMLPIRLKTIKADSLVAVHGIARYEIDRSGKEGYLTVRHDGDTYGDKVTALLWMRKLRRLTAPMYDPATSPAAKHCMEAIEQRCVGDLFEHPALQAGAMAVLAEVRENTENQ